MTDHYDVRETQDPEARERILFAALPDLLLRARERAPGWARILDDVDARGVTSRDALARLPVLRKSELPRMQAENPPFGGLNATAPADLARLYMSPGPIFEPEGRRSDWWGVARALFAAGIRRGDIVHNAFGYHLTPAGMMFETGAMALGCAVIPAGTGNTESQARALAQFRPRAFVGTPDFLKVLLDKAAELGLDASSLQIALVSGAAFPASLRSEIEAHGIDAVQAYGTADLGIVAFESAGGEGMILNEDLILEILRPGTPDPVPEGEVGEVTVTRLDQDYPLFRFATGDLSAVMPGRSPCGRTNLRIRGWMGRADQATKVKGMFVHPSQVAEIGRRHPELGRLRLVVARAGEQDVMSLQAEAAGAEPGLSDRVAETLQAVTKLRGTVELVAPGSIPNDGKVIADERSFA